MSVKWARAQQWEREHLTGVLTPVRWVLHALSTVKLAIVLLALLAGYGILASVPIGIIAAVPTWIFYALTLFVALVLGAALPVWVVGRSLRGAGRGTRFAAGLLSGVALAGLSAWAWGAYVLPALRYDPASGRGVMFFADFVQRNWSVTARRLPGMEMSELEFYAWWPLELILGLFVVNMVVTTLRRIEFKFVNLGVLTVHTGIVILALGSAFYAALKQEGDTILLAGPPDEKTGLPSAGEPVGGFFDNTRTVLRVRHRDGTRLVEQRLLTGLPRYNDYALDAAGVLTGDERAMDRGRTLDIPVPGRSSDDPDADVRLRVVGYASYCELQSAWQPASPAPGEPARAARVVELLSSLPVQGGAAPSEPRLAGSFVLVPGSAPDRRVELSERVSVELTRGMDDACFALLGSELPPGTADALSVKIPAQGFGALVPIRPGQTLTLGSPAWTIRVSQIHEREPFPIVTSGYAGASSSVAVLEVTPPAGEGFTRYCYSRFPEITQDLSMSRTNERGMPVRSAPDASIELAYLDASGVRVHIDERDGGGARAIVRVPGQAVRVMDPVAGGLVPIAPMVSLRLGESWAHAARARLPKSVPERERTQREAIGTHAQAAIAVEVTSDKPELAGVRRVVWVPFAKYYNNGPADTGVVDLPDGRTLELGFGRLWRPLPEGLSVQLTGFEMIPYPHTQTPRDYRSDLAVYRRTSAGATVRDAVSTSMNEPLRLIAHAPDPARPAWLESFMEWLSSMGPNGFKVSQSGWDAAGWARTRELAEQGQVPRAFASFTILGVGNDPGKMVIALGGILMALGTPWAFYIKPWLVRRASARLRAQHAGRCVERPEPELVTEEQA